MRDYRLYLKDIIGANVNGGVSPGITVVNEQQQKELTEAFFDGVWGKTDGIFPMGGLLVMKMARRENHDEEL